MQELLQKLNQNRIFQYKNYKKEIIQFTEDQIIEEFINWLQPWNKDIPEQDKQSIIEAYHNMNILETSYKMYTEFWIRKYNEATIISSIINT